MADGAYVYDAKANVLKPAASGDLRKLTSTVPCRPKPPLEPDLRADFGENAEYG